MKVKKGHLKKNMLAKLGKMTLAQKIQKAAGGAESVQEAAQNLKGMLSKEEHSKAWSKHNVTMKSKTNKEKKDFAKLSKGEKGLEVSMHLLRTSVPRFMQVKETMDQSHSLDKREAWESEAAMIQRFGAMSFCNMSSQDVLPGGKTPGLGVSTITATEEMSQRIPGSGSKSNGQGLRSMNLEKKKMKSLTPCGT